MRRRPESPPPVLVGLACLGALFLIVPLVALVARSPWRRLPSLLNSSASRQALWLSIETATCATAICFAVGVPLALLLARGRHRWLRVVVTLPIALPPVVGGVALLLAFGRNGVLGKPLDAAFGVTVPFTTAAVVLAETFVALPYLVLAVEGALRLRGTRQEVVAATLGAGRWTTFRRVTLPQIVPALITGGVLCWARALGEFGATITFAGSLPGVTQTMPLQIYETLQVDQDAAVASALLLLLVAVLVLAGLRRRWLIGLT